MKRKDWRAKLHSISYMQTSLALFVICLILLLYLCLRAVLTHGGLKTWEGILGFLGMILTFVGLGVPLYGKFVVKAKDRPDYRLGFLLNAVLFLIYVFFYFLGI